MPVRTDPPISNAVRRILRLSPLILLLFSLACSLPFGGPTPTATRWVPSATPTLPPAPSATPQPMPPVLVESDPPQSAELPLNGPITLYFDQDMDRASVEAALSSQMGPGLGFTWIDNSTVIVRLTSPLQPDSELSLLIGDGVRSSQGKPLLQTVALQYRTAGFLALSLMLPEPGAAEIDPTAAVIAAFNRPIVPLGAQTGDLPAAFTLEPPAAGNGEWLNTSTYVFYPEPALAGGQSYTVRPNPGLTSIDGGPLQAANPWSFTTARPKLLSLTPDTGTAWPIDAEVEMKFNQPMDRAAVEAAFSLVADGGAALAGRFEWTEDDTIMKFKPNALLTRNSGYTVMLSDRAAGLGGAAIEQPFADGIITVSALQVGITEPQQGGQIDPAGSLVLHFSAPIQPTIADDILPYLTLTPAVADLNSFWDGDQNLLRVHGSFAPNTAYTLQIAPTLTDKWGGPLAQEFTLTFSTTAFRPDLTVVAPSRTMFISAQDAALEAQAVNLDAVPLSLGPLGLDEFIAMSAPNGYEVIEALKTRPAQSWTQPIMLSPDAVRPVELPLAAEGAALSPGLYFMRFNFPQNTGDFRGSIDNGPFLLAISNLQVVLKAGGVDALAWVTDLRTNAPAANLPLTLYDESGAPLAQGRTDDQGIFTAQFPALENSYSTLYAVVAAPGDPNFGLGMSTWSAGIDAWDFDIPSGDGRPGLQTYFYTDRPIYRPGQTVYYRAVVRQAFNGRFSPPEISKLPVVISGSDGQELMAVDLPVSALGTTHGEFQLPAEAPPGFYGLNTSAGHGAYLSFQVAAYRKPEINLQVGFTEAETRAGNPLRAEINARFFFDAPAGNVEARWFLYRRPTFFNLPGYQVGKEDTSWMDVYRFPDWYTDFGELVDEGSGRTGPDGLLMYDFPTQPTDQIYQYSLEVTLVDDSNLPVSARASRTVHPDDFYIGIRPDAWVGRTAQASDFEIQVVDWQKRPAGERRMRAAFQKVTWKRIEPPSSAPFELPTYAPQYQSIGATDFVTGADGLARLAFTPPEPGTYMLDVFSLDAPQNQGARSQLLQWVGGAGQAVWPSLPNARLKLVADRDQYQPGDTAQIFIPNPFGQPVQALITVERSIVMHHELRSLPPEGIMLDLPLPGDYAPNVFLSVTLLGAAPGGRPDFRQGYINLAVAPVEQTLQVSLVGEPQRAGPGDTVTFEIQVTDSSGSPAQGEFSLSVVDLAVLALADPNSEDIVSAFYKEQPLGVRTGLSLAAHNRRNVDVPGGLGGGGGAEAAQVAREHFPDTAYWNAEVTTGPDGRASVSMALPDTLTTWQAETRGLTLDTRVGQAQTQVVATKDLLVRPVTPRFFVANDHVELAAVVQNNSDQDLAVQVSLQAAGFTLDNPAGQTQAVNVPAHDRFRVAWWGTVQDVESVDLVLSASGGGFEDATRPAAGSLPVLRFYTPQVFRTAGILEGQGEIIEYISLPRSFDPQSGQLDIEMAPSLAAATLRALDALENDPHQSVEQALSSFLPNLELYRTLEDFGITDAGLSERLDRNLNAALPRLQTRQNYDGGWAWWQGGESDAYITSYVLYGLLRARQAGIAINQSVIERAVLFLNTPPSDETAPGAPADANPATPQTWVLDRRAFQQFVLSEAGGADPARLDELLAARESLSAWSRALLALTLQRTQPGAPEVQSILSDLQTAAVRSATGAYWELSQDENGRMAGGYNMQSTLSNSAIVVFVLAQRDPGSPLVADAVRYLMAQRGADGAWTSSYTTAWALMGLNEVMKSTGEAAANYTFEAALNSSPLAQGQASGVQSVGPVTAQASLGQLYTDRPNQLALRRGAGNGRLYYAVGLEVSRPVEEVTPLSQGLSISRIYQPFGEAACPQGDCEAITTAQTGEKVTVRLSLTAQHDVFHVAISDFIPAGAEILDITLKTSRLGIGGDSETQVLFDPRRPLAQGWGWWLFNAPQVYDDHIVWTADRLPAGTYELTYTLVPLQAGQYRVLPARAWEIYFPEVQANSAGAMFEITP